jgi:hypothetical protein
MNIPLDVAQKQNDAILALCEELAKEFPCPDCEGTGEGEARQARDFVDGGPPCNCCWGRGYLLPDKEDG